MFGRNFDLTFATFLLTLSFPILLINAFCVRGKELTDQTGLARRDPKNTVSNKDFDRNSSFDHAIAAYEELIDATVSGKAQ